MFLLNILDDMKWRLVTLIVSSSIIFGMIGKTMTEAEIEKLKYEENCVYHENILSSPPTLEETTIDITIVEQKDNIQENSFKVSTPNSPKQNNISKKEDESIDDSEDYWYADVHYDDNIYIITNKNYESFIASILEIGVPENFFSPEKIEVEPEKTETIVHNAKNVIWNDTFEKEFEEWLEDKESEDDEDDEDDDRDYNWEDFLSEKGLYDPDTGILSDRSNVEEVTTEAVYEEKQGYIDLEIDSNFDSISPIKTIYKIDPDKQEILENILFEQEKKPYDIPNEELPYKNPNLVQKGETLYEVALNNDGTSVRWLITDEFADSETKRLLELNDLWEGDALFVEDASYPTEEKDIAPMVIVRRVKLNENGERIENTYRILRSDILDTLAPLGSNTPKDGVYPEVEMVVADNAVG